MEHNLVHMELSACRAFRRHTEGTQGLIDILAGPRSYNH